MRGSKLHCSQYTRILLLTVTGPAPAVRPAVCGPILQEDTRKRARSAYDSPEGEQNNTMSRGNTLY